MSSPPASPLSLSDPASTTMNTAKRAAINCQIQMEIRHRSYTKEYENRFTYKEELHLSERTGGKRIRCPSCARLRFYSPRQMVEGRSSLRYPPVLIFIYAIVVLGPRCCFSGLTKTMSRFVLMYRKRGYAKALIKTDASMFISIPIWPEKFKSGERKKI